MFFFHFRDVCQKPLVSDSNLSFLVSKAFMAQNLLYSAIQDQLEECCINISEELRNPFSIFSRKTHLRFQSLILSNALYNYTFLKNFTLLLTDKHPSTRVIFDWGHSLAKIWKPSELIAQHAKKSSTPNCKLANSYQHSITWLTHHLWWFHDIHYTGEQNFQTPWLDRKTRFYCTRYTLLCHIFGNDAESKMKRIINNSSELR